MASLRISRVLSHDTSLFQKSEPKSSNCSATGGDQIIHQYSSSVTITSQKGYFSPQMIVTESVYMKSVEVRTSNPLCRAAIQHKDFRIKVSIEYQSTVFMVFFSADCYEYIWSGLNWTPDSKRKLVVQLQDGWYPRQVQWSASLLWFEFSLWVLSQKK